jgi:hypothetical protein
VLAALLQAALGLRSLAQRGSKQPGVAGADGQQEQDQSQQQQQQQQPNQQAAHTGRNVQSKWKQQESKHQFCSDTISRPCSSATDDEQLQLQGSSSSSTCSWQELLQLLLATAGEGARSAAVRAAALQELRQLLLHLADALSVSGVASAAPPAAAAAVAQEAVDADGQQSNQSSSSSSKCELAAARDALLPAVLPLALAALQEEQQELRRWVG